ncbi:monocarboxylate transporter [Pyrenophora seminiperda CCB06]|uniref:Monocarboxylate transporter n=1 Tax=Pyrenophora seminiperda CCB06 TaxID=1302712 RepID=A0A3M7MJ15_9PLEO|nr:monocarboxylate transporter [Pyrenophora seminiperda CCB06]
MPVVLVVSNFQSLSDNEKSLHMGTNPSADAEAENAGVNQSSGVFQAYYGRQQSVQEGVFQGNEYLNRPLISAIGALGNGGLVAVFGAFYYPYLSKLGGHITSLCAAGSVLVVLGLGAAALGHNLATILGCQGVLVGLGSGILTNVLLPILPEYFPERAGLAQGVMFAFVALGGMVGPFMLIQLLETLGIRWTLGILAMLSAITMGIASGLALPPRKFEKRNTHMIGWKAMRDPLFLSLAMVNLTIPLTSVLPMTFGPVFAESLGFSISKASYLVAINSGVGILTRPGIGWLGDRVGHLNMLMAAIAVYVLATFTLWLSAALVSNIGLYISMCVFHGLVTGVFGILINSAQTTLFGAEMYYPKSGVMTSIRGIGLVISAPIAGSLVSKVSPEDLQGRDFVRLILYTGLMLIVALLALGIVRWLDAKKNGWKKAR